MTVEQYRRSDDEARASIRGALDSTLFVEAGAGTGKTSALVDRVVALVLGGRAIDRIAAITFTERAAAELRDRVRQGLEQALRDQSGRRDVIEAALESLDRAQISTIHSFCQSLLRAYAAEAGVDPSFEVHDEVMAERRFQEQWRRCLEERAKEPESLTAVDRVLSLGLTARDLEKLARELNARPGLAAILHANPLTAPEPTWPDPRALRADFESLPLDTAPPEDELRVRVEELLALVTSLDGEDRESALAAGRHVVDYSWRKSNMGVWGRENINLVRDTAKDVAGRLSELLEAARSHALSRVLPIIVRFVLEDSRQRAREGTLTFDDLILRVRDLLAEDQNAVRSLRDRFDALLIDEFQDTDPLQVDIALAFGTDPDTGRLEPGRLFLVGDPKQSIYRFRRADMAVYSRTLRKIREQQGVFPELALNRRSRDVILDWVNAVFPKMIVQDDGVQPSYHAIHAHREDSLIGRGVARTGGPQPAQARAVRQMEAEEIAARCRAVLDEGWQVFDKREDDTRPARFADIAVLIPRRTILAPLERALAGARVPYRVEGGSLVYRTQEVRDLINCLTAIDDPGDEVAVVGALRSPAFACSDVDLARHVAAGGRFNYLRPGKAPEGTPVVKGLRTLERYHSERYERPAADGGERRHPRSIASLIEDFAAECGLVETGILDRGDRDSFRRVRFLVDQARAFEAAGPESLRSFVEWIERRSNQQILDNEGAGVDDDEDAVRVMTIHAAKGLEFPIVFIAGLSAAPLYQTETFLVDRVGGQVAVCIGRKGNNSQFLLGDYERLRDLEKRHEDAEWGRLLYVASTRARDHLVVSLYYPERSRTCAAQNLIDAGALDHCAELPPLPRLEPATLAPFTGIDVEIPDVAGDEEFLAQRRQLLERARTVSYTSATALGPLWKEEGTDESEPWSRGRAGTRIGRAVHAAIQSLPLDADDAMIAAFSRAQAVAEAVPDLTRDVERLVKRALASEAAQRARAARRALREVPFAVQVDGRVLEGFVDLLIETEDGIEIVDWKTDRVPENEVPQRLQQYEMQAGLYVYGIERATERRVTAVTYVFASAGVERSPGEPDALRKLAEEKLAVG